MSIKYKNNILFPFSATRNVTRTTIQHSWDRTEILPITQPAMGFLPLQTNMVESLETETLEWELEGLINNQLTIGNGIYYHR